ncbi:MAG: 5-bromo-4-chloroindolyl phosphate hydrolysis family protein [Bacillota bacterium]|nr:5-bromo-4-chloroindolyl phosphate hydrolysis family protein [Bacillota bacterium]
MKRSQAGRTALAAALALGVFGLVGFAFSWPLPLAGIMAVGTYGGTYLLSKRPQRIGKVRVDRLPGGSQLKVLLLEAEADMEAIRRASREIAHIELRQEVKRLIGTGERILLYLGENPERIGNARRFFIYYLDTARTILEKYISVQKSGLDTAQVRQVRQETIRIVPQLTAAFERQFTNLMSNELVAIESEIKLLESTLKAEGGT